MKLNKVESRKIRHFRIRNKIHGTKERPRLNVFRSNKHFYAQVIDDVSMKTLVGLSTEKLDLKVKSNKEAASKLGTEIVKLCLAKKIKVVVFDRGGYLYHGRVKAFADAAREAGLEF